VFKGWNIFTESSLLATTTTNGDLFIADWSDTDVLPGIGAANKYPNSVDIERKVVSRATSNANVEFIVDSRTF
jgi:hypothetical protein